MKPSLAVIVVLSLASCSPPPAKKSAEHHYPLSGKVVSLNAKDQTALIDAAAIPNFMEPMTMDYPVKSKSEFESLKAGEQITATVDVSDEGGYALSNIQNAPAGKK